MRSVIKISSALFLLATPLVHADDELKAGEAVYNNACMICHAEGISESPVFGDKDAWAPRIEKGMDALVESVTNGLGVMPPRGACPDCSDEDLEAAVKYMVDAAQ